MGSRLSGTWLIIGEISLLLWLCLTLAWKISALPLLSYLLLLPLLVFMPLYYIYCPQSLRYGVLMLWMGVLCNQIVVLANGGFMPVAGGKNYSVWVELADGHHLVFLADILPFGFSYGDFIMLVGLALILLLPMIGWLLEKKRGVLIK